MKRASLLIVDNDPMTQRLAQEVLEAEGYFVRQASSLFQARGALARSVPDLLILECRLPDGDGMDLCKELRSTPPTAAIPVIVLTENRTLSNHVACLKLGADDFIAKPFSPQVLEARVGSALGRARRAPPGSPDRLRSGGVELDLPRHECRSDRKPVKLWRQEFELLRAFLERPRHLLSRAYLLERSCGREYVGATRAVDMAIHRLRGKLGRHGQRIETVRGYGFRWNSVAQDAACGRK